MPIQMIQKIKNNWRDIPSSLTWYFIGPPKTGKTTQASKWSVKGSDGVVLLDTDLGADFVDDANIIPITSLAPPFRNVKDKNGKNIVETIGGKERDKVEIVPPDERGLYYRVGINKGKPMPVYSMVEALDYLRTNWKDLPFDTIAIDTVDKINEWQEKMTKERFHIEALADLDFGKGWSIPKENQLGSIASLQLFLRSVSGNLVMISHSKNTTTVDKKVQLVPDIPSGVGKGLCKIAEVIGFTTCNKANGKYYVSFLAYEERNIGSRLKPLAQKRLEFDYKTVINEIKNYKEK